LPFVNITRRVCAVGQTRGNGGAIRDGPSALKWKVPKYRPTLLVVMPFERFKSYFHGSIVMMDETTFQ